MADHAGAGMTRTILTAAGVAVALTVVAAGLLIAGLAHLASLADEGVGYVD